MTKKDRDKKNLIAQWAFDSRPILLRFHLWLEDVEVEWLRGSPRELNDVISFVEPGTERRLIMTVAVCLIVPVQVATAAQLAVPQFARPIT